MKDYSMNKEERKKFILGYKIKNGIMKIKYALGFKDNIPYSEENEKKALDKMKEQVSKIDSDKFTLNKKRNIIFDFSIGSVCALGSILIFFGPINSGMEVFANIVGSLFALSGIVLISNGVILTDRLNDYKKNKRFMEIESKLNSKVRKNENMLVNTSTKTKNMVNSTPKDKPVFNINSFNYVPNRDLEQIMDNIDRDDYFKYNYDKGISIEGPKTKKKTK